MNLKIEIQNIWLVFLILFGSVTLSFYAHWVVTTTFPPIGIEMLGHSLLLFVLVFIYCLGATAFFFRKSGGCIVSPVAVWLFILLINLLGYFYQTVSLKQDVLDIIMLLMLVYLSILMVVLFFGLFQQAIMRKIFGFIGDEDNCYYKSYTTSDNYEKVVNTLTDEDWLYYISRLKLRKKIEPTRLKMKAYDVHRDCNLFFFADKKDEKNTRLNIVAYVRNATSFSSFIDCPDWCKELTDNIVSIIKDKGITLNEDNGLELKKETFEYALKNVKPLISQETVERFSLPLFLLPILIFVVLSTYYVLKMDATLTLGVATLVLTFFAILLEHRRRQ